MWLREIEADRLRNLKQVRVDLAAGVTLVVGRNGQGKTSLLESVYLLATGSSFRTRRIDELVARGGGPLRVAGSVTGRRGSSRLTVQVDEGERRLVADALERELRDYLGRLDVVDLAASRMQVVRGSPVERRRFLDRGLVGLQPDLLLVIADYRKVLRQRNALLRRGGGGDRHLDAWDVRLADAAARLHGERRRYAMRLATALGPPIRAMFPDGEELVLTYRPSPAETRERDPGELAGVFAEALARDRQRDLDVGHTCRGPHRDELGIDLADVDLRRFGSAGQVRAAMVALKLAKLCLLREDRGEAPLFLMDDFDTDLDEARASALADFMTGGGFQVLLATSKEALADRLGVPCARVRMDGGSARPV